VKVLLKLELKAVNGGQSCSSCEAAGASAAKVVKVFNKAVSGAPIR
jgi:hypothetical protein